MDYLNQTMESLSQLPGLQKMALYISQDGNNSKVSTLIEEARANWFSGKVRQSSHWYHPREPLVSENQVELVPKMQCTLKLIFEGYVVQHKYYKYFF